MRGGLQRFAVRTNTTLVQRLHVVEHLHPQVTRNPGSEWEEVVVYPEAETLIVGKTYSLKLKANLLQSWVYFDCKSASSCWS